MTASKPRADGSGQARADPFAQVRHDLRTPVNQIIGYGEMLQEQVEDMGDETMAEDLVKITHAARKLLELQDELFGELSKQPAAAATPTPSAPPSASTPDATAGAAPAPSTTSR